MSGKTVYMVVEADNIGYNFSVHGPFTTKEKARATLKKQYRAIVSDFKSEERTFDDKYITKEMYKVLLEDSDLFYGRIMELVIEEPDTEAERWVKAVKDHMEAKNVSIPQEEYELAHIADEAQHYAAKDEYFVGGFWNAIAFAVQDYLDKLNDAVKAADRENDDG